MKDAKEIAAWFREQTFEEDLEVAPGLTFRIQPVRATRLHSATDKDKAVDQFIAAGLISPKVWLDDPAACPYDDGFVPIGKLAKYETKIMQALTRLSVADDAESEAVSFRDSQPAGGRAAGARAANGTLAPGGAAPSSRRVRARA